MILMGIDGKSERPVKQVIIDMGLKMSEDLPCITFSGTKFEPVLILTGTSNQFDILISRIIKTLNGE